MKLVAVVMGLLALAVPPAATARMLVGPDASHLARVVMGVWVFKAMLLLHTVLLAWWVRDRANIRETAGLVDADSGLSHTSQTDRWTVWTLAVLLGGALVLRSIGLQEGLWYDEIKTWVLFVSQPLGHVVSTFDDQNQHLLYSIAAKLTTSLFGPDAWALRLPAVLGGVASLWAVYWFGTHVGGKREAFLATAVLTFSYHHVWFSQNARGYTGLLLFSLLSTGLFLRLVANERPTDRGLPVAYGMTIALAMLTHVTAGAVFVAHAVVGLAILWRGRGPNETPARAPILWGLVLAVTLSIQLYAIVLPQMAGAILLTPSHGGSGIEWKNPLWMLTELVRGLGRGVPGGPLTLLAGVAVLGVGTVSFGRRQPVATALMLLPGVVTGAVILALGHNLWPRFFFFSAGFAALLLVRGLFAGAALIHLPAAPRWASVATGLAILVSAGTVPRAWAAKQDYFGALEYVEEARAEGDAVAIVDLSIRLYKEYWETDWVVVDDAGDLRELEGQHERTWLVYAFPTSLSTLHPDVWSRLQDQYELAAEFPGTVSGGNVIVMVNR
jgi:hypothetical protein